MIMSHLWVSQSPHTLLNSQVLESGFNELHVVIHMSQERLDFSCALFGPDGGLVANAPHIPVHLGAMQETVQWQVRYYIMCDLSCKENFTGLMYVYEDVHEEGSCVLLIVQSVIII